jgi:Fe-S-cluster containining protein
MYQDLEDFAGAKTGPAAAADLPPEVRTRIPLAIERARQKSAGARHSQTAHALLAAGGRARTRQQRVVWLQRWGSAWVAPLASQAACRRGCSHCCHIPVALTSAEAALIGASSGRPVATPTGLTCGDLDLPKVAAWEARQRRFVGLPCPFLQGDECGIYDRRPFSCRVHVSLDDDDLLCRLVPGHAPYADTRQVQAIFMAAQRGETMADIREFFPS